jgi:hypothetical protein
VGQYVGRKLVCQNPEYKGIWGFMAESFFHLEILFRVAKNQFAIFGFESEY